MRQPTAPLSFSLIKECVPASIGQDKGGRVRKTCFSLKAVFDAHPRNRLVTQRRFPGVLELTASGNMPIFALTRHKYLYCINLAKEPRGKYV